MPDRKLSEIITIYIDFGLIIILALASIALLSCYKLLLPTGIINKLLNRFNR